MCKKLIYVIELNSLVDSKLASGAAWVSLSSSSGVSTEVSI